ncbi:sulfur carrier protein ThiS [Actinoallomurus iriomotensis]|jgi:sulfur carrier protein|uniref:Thiamine biosynthesis protein ThiS n=1 Tax=Actinoallomurus iriomotensis TaxID=478107 RepID=A0A9W6VHM9_9ACTN|nr:sulfur carrier protein ThiS [Actinoallomurus iriomotensis]GLY72053.1 thiamine biosynthesis protein ThiS [Actinoallomurus iriomotensis]GLY82852.1 thiamine biosynthesis protein ThiS [Actinoallomurus iriomotensis]
MKITVNGAEREAEDGATVAGVVASVTRAPAGVAVALNDQVVPRGDWPTTIVREADRIEVLTAVQGG